MWLTRDVKADVPEKSKINMKRKDKVGPKIKYDEMHARKREALWLE